MVTSSKQALNLSIFVYHYYLCVFHIVGVRPPGPPTGAPSSTAGAPGAPQQSLFGGILGGQPAGGTQPNPAAPLAVQLRDLLQQGQVRLYTFYKCIIVIYILFSPNR